MRAATEPATVGSSSATATDGRAAVGAAIAFGTAPRRTAVATGLATCSRASVIAEAIDGPLVAINGSSCRAGSGLVPIMRRAVGNFSASAKRAACEAAKALLMRGAPHFSCATEAR